MEFDTDAKDFLLDDSDRAMLAVDWSRVPAEDARNLLAAKKAMDQRVRDRYEAAQGGGALEEASAERDLDYCRAYSRHVFDLLRRHGKFPRD